MDHEAAVKTAQLSSGENLLLTTTEAQVARIWDVRSRKQLGIRDYSAEGLDGAQLTADGNRVVTWSHNSTRSVAQLWTTRPWALIFTMDHNDRINGTKFSADENRILTWSEDGTARVWDTRDGRPVGPPLLHDESSVSGARLSRDGRSVLTWANSPSSGLGGLYVWDVRTGKLIVPELKHQGKVMGAEFSSHEDVILSWSDDGTARLWDSRTGLQIGRSLQHSKTIKGARFNRLESRVLTWSDDKTARIWDVKTGHQIGPPLTHDDSVGGAEFNSAETSILTWSRHSQSLAHRRRSRFPG
jgi:WD40 repeat protein